MTVLIVSAVNACEDQLYDYLNGIDGAVVSSGALITGGCGFDSL